MSGDLTPLFRDALVTAPHTSLTLNGVGVLVPLPYTTHSLQTFV